MSVIQGDPGVYTSVAFILFMDRHSMCLASCGEFGVDTPISVVRLGSCDDEKTVLVNRRHIGSLLAPIVMVVLDDA